MLFVFKKPPSLILEVLNNGMKLLECTTCDNVSELDCLESNSKSVVFAN